MDPHEKTIKTAGHIVKYSRELYNLHSVEEVANLTLEMTQHFLEGGPMPALVELRDCELRVLASMVPDVSMTDDAGDLIDSVVTNSLSNAAVHNDGDVAVRVYGEQPSPTRVMVGMAVDGSGVPDSIRDDIFEMGKKGPESDGSGFGLGLARTLLESYGGGISVGESDRGGADFRIYLERAPVVSQTRN